MSKTKTLAKSYVKKKAYGVILSVLGSIGCGGLLLIMLFAIIIISSFFAFNNYQEEVEKNSSSSSNGDTKCIGGNMSKNSLAEFEKNAKGGALEGKTKQMQKIAKQEKIPEILFFSIVAHESGWGKDSNSKIEKNPFSIMGTGPLVKYDTIEEGLKDGARNLYDLYIAEGLTTPEKIGPKYAPIGADNDQTNVNSNWVTSVKTIMKQFKGSNVSCEKSNTKGSNAKGSNFKGEIPEWDNNPEKLNLYTPGQCTWYVYAIRKKMNKPVSTYYHDA